MKYHQITGIDKPVSRLIQGTVYFTEANKDEAFALYDAVFEQGCNTFDTAHIYVGGECERVLGDWIRTRNIRDEVVILDKGAHPIDDRQRVTADDISSDIYESLERLGVEHIDLYILHRDDPSQPVAGIMDCLYEHHQAGRISAIGGSNWSHQRIKEANDYARKNDLLPFVASNPQFSLAEMVKPTWEDCISIGHDKDAQAWYQNNDMALFTWSSLAGGFMAGRFSRDNLDSFDDYFAGVNINAYAYEDNFRRLDRAKDLAQEKSISLPQLALAYVLNQALNIFALIGSMTPEQFTDNASALDIHLSDNELAWLNLEQDTLSE